MALFVGEFEQTIDAKHRLAVSSALREQIVPGEDGSHFILVLGPDRHLWLYPDQYYTRMLRTLKQSPLPSRQNRKIDLFFAMARVLKGDAQGRVVLPEKSMSRAVVDSNVTLVGINDHIEIWPTAEWEARVEAELDNYGEALYDAADHLEEHSAEKD